MADFEQAAKTRKQTGMAAEFWYFLKNNKKWWLLPIVVIVAGLRRARAAVGHGRGAVHLHALLNSRTWLDERSGDPHSGAAESSSTRRVLAVLALLVSCEGALRVRAMDRSTARRLAGVRDPMVACTTGDADLVTCRRPGYEVKRRADQHQDQLARLPRRRVHPREARQHRSGSPAWAPRRRSARRCRPTTIRGRTCCRSACGRPIPASTSRSSTPPLGGYVADDNLKNLRHRVMPLDPDLVIYYEANNEIVRDTQALAAREGLLRADGARQSPLVTHCRSTA